MKSPVKLLLLLMLLLPCQTLRGTYGFLTKHEGTAPITKFTVIAERASGSNYMEALMMFNAMIPTVPFFHKHFPPWYELPLEKYFGEKNFYTFENTDDYLFIVIFRNPYDWVRSLYRQPHLASVEMRSASFDAFLHRPWELDKRDPLFAAEYKYNPLLDRNPRTGAPFENILKLRTTKAKNMLMIKDKAKNVYFINYEVVRDHPQEVLAEISKIYQVPLKSSYTPIVHYKGHTALPLYKGSKYRPLTPDQILYINSQLDKELEAQLGYSLQN
jgi:hypothetical protein